MSNYQPTPESSANSNDSAPSFKALTELFFRRLFEPLGYDVRTFDNVVSSLTEAASKAVVDEYHAPDGPDADPPASPDRPVITVHR
ncbi:hypothetical protein [Rhizobium leguminosarum]|uniref:hypothetical protein n=1 Tax=Rhizobium leguminosarum TaxID=384 RepID=UPI00102FE815|nr:hypothetical protein [Rhizobium leguminosarum]MBY5416224.1 hypothetical protein [Rhizobium leguminosarum]TBF82716.1 hypothetical protein ELG86_11550 [Rhizobium leguminosarum]TBH02200.1 hypothetical protein ELG70_11515 [Rhizobium leguminosarum]TBH36658.1 hypothetical protein ELG66_12845 [Rhizobium leguminosarum]TBH41847.1 hypothetical protein ELG63_10985 [Rhizobium leguminosarum]